MSAGVPVQFWMGFGAASLVVLALLTPSGEALSNPEEALLAALWVVGLCMALWFTLSLALVHFADLSGSRLLLRISSAAAMPLARRLAHGSLALGLVALPACGSAGDARPTMVLVESGVSTSTSSTASSFQLEPLPSAAYQAPTSVADSPSTSHPTTAPELTTAPAVPAEPEVLAEFSSPDSAAGPEFHIVTQGESLWSIAKAHLTHANGTSPSNSQVAPYWAELVEANRASLSSGNISLIYPGESIHMPAIPPSSAGPMAG